jgi:hypothetical protein
MIDLSKVQEELNMKLSQGFRTVFYIIAKEVSHTAKKLGTIVGSRKIDECTRNICKGATAEELAKLVKSLDIAGKTLTSFSKSIQNEFVSKYPDADIEQCISEQTEKSQNDIFSILNEKMPERFHRGSFIVDEMLHDYLENLDREVENSTRSQLYNYRYHKENADYDSPNEECYQERN